MDIGLSLNGISSQPRKPTQGGGAGPVFAPVPGILDAANVVLLGASITQAMGVKSGYLASCGFTGMLHNYAVAGHKVIDCIAVHAQAQADLAADEGNNLYIVHIGGNNVSGQRPYPGGAATFQSDYDTLMANITATGDRVIPLPLTKRLYGIDAAGYPTNPGDVVQGDAASEANGSKPYNEATVYPAVAAYAPGWVDGQGVPYVNPYRGIDRDPWILGADGVHGPEHPLARYIMSRVAGRALGQREGVSKAGRGYVFGVEQANPSSGTLGTINRLRSYKNAPFGNPLLHGAQDDTGTLDPFIKARMSAFSNPAPASNTGAFGRIADTRFHDADLVTRGIYVEGGLVFRLTYGDLTPGDTVRVSCMGTRQASGSGRRGTVTLGGGQSLVLDAATSAASNQIVFDPVVIPPTGELELTLAVAPGSSYGYLHGVILDFL